MMRISSSVTLFVCFALCASQPVEKLPVLKQMPSEVVFRENKEFVLQCVTEGKEGGITYKWLKNGNPFSPNANVVQQENEGTLLFKNPKKNDEGKYKCLAESSYGVASSSTSLKLTYIDIPKVTLHKHKPVEGNMYKLDCKIPNSYPKPEIVWMYTSVSDPSASRTILDRRITLSPEADLYFSNVTKEDTSKDYKYVCVAKSVAVDDDVVLAEHLLEDVVLNNAVEDHALYPQYVSQDFTTTVGSVTMIYCIYGGTPLAYPDWFKDGKNTNNEPGDRVTRYNRTSGKRLLIKDTWLVDQGNYTCIVDNEMGPPHHHTMRLTVVSAPQFTKQPEKKIIAKAGQDVTVPCQIAGVPSPRLSWTKDARELRQNNKVHIQNSSHGNVTIADLTIKNVEKDDGGYYGCKGLNENGEVYSETLIFVQ